MVVVDDFELPVSELGGGVVELLEELLGDVELLLVPEELEGGLVDELGGLVLLVVSVGVLDEDEDGGSGGVGGVVVELVVLLVLGVVELGGVTTVVRSSLRSQPATPRATATAKALDSKILDFMGNSF